VEVRNVQNIALSAKFGETGDLQHELKIKCVLNTGDMERILLMLKERVKSGAPVIIQIASPQAKMDLFVSEVDYAAPKGKTSITNPEQKKAPEKTVAVLVMEAINDVDLLQDGDNYSCRIGELLGKGDCPRDAILDVLMGQDVAHGFRIGESGTIVEQIASYMREKFPPSDIMERLLWALANNDFNVPGDLSKPKRKAKDKILA